MRRCATVSDGYGRSAGGAGRSPRSDPAGTITRKRAVFHNALGYAVELGLLAANPLSQIQWHAPKATTAVDPRVIASPEQVDAVLTQAGKIRPELTAFFGCLYYAALRPAEAVALRRDCLTLPALGWGQPALTASLPRSARSCTGNGTSRELRGLKLRPEGTVRTVPIPPQLVRLLRYHLQAHGTTADGRLFPGTRGGPLSESLYGRIWHQARAAALPARQGTQPVRRPYDLRHAALSLWLASGAPPAEIATRAGHSVHVLLTVYAHCVPGHDQIASQHIGQALRPSRGTQPVAGPRNPYDPGRPRPPCVRVTARRSGTRLDVPGPPLTDRTAGELRKHPRNSSTLAGRGPTGPDPSPNAPQAADQAGSGPPLAHKHRERSGGPLPDTQQARHPATPGPGLTWGFTWQVVDSNHRRRSRRFYSPVPWRAPLRG